MGKFRGNKIEVLDMNYFPQKLKRKDVYYKPIWFLRYKCLQRTATDYSNVKEYFAIPRYHLRIKILF